jgi:hypothetical protein
MRWCPPRGRGPPPPAVCWRVAWMSGSEAGADSPCSAADSEPSRHLWRRPKRRRSREPPRRRRPRPDRSARGPGRRRRRESPPPCAGRRRAAREVAGVGVRLAELAGDADEGVAERGAGGLLGIAAGSARVGHRNWVVLSVLPPRPKAGPSTPDAVPSGSGSILPAADDRAGGTTPVVPRSPVRWRVRRGGSGDGHPPHPEAGPTQSGS